MPVKDDMIFVYNEYLRCIRGAINKLKQWSLAKESQLDAGNRAEVDYFNKVIKQQKFFHRLEMDVVELINHYTE